MEEEPPDLAAADVERHGEAVRTLLGAGAALLPVEGPVEAALRVEAQREDLPRAMSH